MLFSLYAENRAESSCPRLYGRLAPALAPATGSEHWLRGGWGRCLTDHRVVGQEGQTLLPEVELLET